MDRLNDVIDDAARIYKDIQAGTFEFYKLPIFFYNSWGVLTVIEDSCRFYSLFQDLYHLATNPGALIWRVLTIFTVGLLTTVPASFRFIYYIFMLDTFMMGRQVGLIMGVIFNYSIK